MSRDPVAGADYSAGLNGIFDEPVRPVTLRGAAHSTSITDANEGHRQGVELLKANALLRGGAEVAGHLVEEQCLPSRKPWAASDVPPN